MQGRRIQWMVAAGLLVATAVLGAVAGGAGQKPPAATGPVGATVSAPTTAGVSFRGNLDRTAVMLGQDGLVRMELVMAAAADSGPRSTRRPTDVVIVLDRSGSMSGEKLEQARAAIRELLAQLDQQDRFSLVAYSDDAVLAIPLAAVDEASRQRWLSTVNEIGPSGGTNMSSGLDLALQLIENSRVAGRVPRLLLISDGLANQGDASHDGLVRRAQRAARGEYMLSTIGVGTDFNEYLMTALADAGTGNYYYVEHSRDLASVFAREFDAARTTVASGLAVQIQPAAGVRVVEAAGYPLEAVADGVLFRPGSLFAGQERRLWVTLAVPHDKLGEYDLGQVALSFGDSANRSTVRLGDLPRIACVEQQDEFYRRVDVGGWGRSVAVESYNQMQADVARAVKEGRRDEALGRLKQFKDETSVMNERLQSAPVAAQLRSVDRLVAAVADAFDGPNQAERQNALSKAASAEAVDARRAGSKK